MFTINIKGKANPKDPKMVKLEMIIFKTGYARATKVLNISGPTQSKLYGRVKRLNAKVNQTLCKICDHSGIKSRVTWETARSSYISKMIDEGFHPLQVAELAGNSPQTIYRHYYTISDKEKMREKMNQVF